MYRQGTLTKEENSNPFHNLLWRQIGVVLQNSRYCVWELHRVGADKDSDKRAACERIAHPTCTATFRSAYDCLGYRRLQLRRHRCYSRGLPKADRPSKPAPEADLPSPLSL